MFDDFILDDLDTFDGIDTSDVDMNDSDLDSSDFFESFGASESNLTDYDDFDSFTSSDENLGTMSDDMDITDDVHSHHSAHGNHSSQISFGGRIYGSCHESGCLCKQFKGYGDICENCFHHYGRHY